MQGLAKMYPTQHGNKTAEELVSEYTHLVQRIAYHLSARLPASVIVDDLIQVGLIGLLDAANLYDPSQGAAFETYATIRVRGAMLDELRRNDWAPKSVHKRARDLISATQKIENKTGRDAHADEVAEEMGITVDEYFDILNETNSCRILNFVEISPDSDFATDSITSISDTPLQQLEENEFQSALVSAINELPEREKLVISLYYDEEFNLREIGEILGVSESRVSQIMSQAHLRIRNIMVA